MNGMSVMQTHECNPDDCCKSGKTHVNGIKNINSIILFFTLKKALTCRCHYLIKHILKTPEDSGQPVYMDKIQTSAPR